SAKKERRAMGRVAHLEDMRGLLIVNPRSGGGASDVDAIAREAASRGIGLHVLAPDDDPRAVARAATGPLGAAGGDGSLGPPAEGVRTPARAVAVGARPQPRADLR